MPTTVTESPLRKAAVFVRSLAPDAAAKMLARLSPDEADALRGAIAELGEVAHDERDVLASELLNRPAQEAPNEPEHEAPAPEAPRPTATSVDGGAVELMLGGPSPPADPVSPVAKPVGAAPEERPFDLAEADPATIAEYLRSEQPPAIALTLGQLSATHAAAVLSHFPVDQQGALLSRVAGQAHADPESVAMVTDGLVNWVRRREDEKRRQRERIATIEEILSATPPEHRGRLLTQLRQEEPEIAAALSPLAPAPTAAAPDRPALKVSSPAAASPPSSAGPPALSDAQLERLDGATLANAARSLDGRTAILALATASDSVVARLSATLGRPAARELRARLRSLGPATLSEIDQARDAFGRAAARAVAHRAKPGVRSLAS